MNDDTRLSTLLKQAAGEPPKVIGMTDVRRRARRQQATILATALGVGLPIVAAAIAVPLVLANRPATLIVPTSPSPTPSSAPNQQTTPTAQPAPTATPTPTPTPTPTQPSPTVAALSPCRLSALTPAVASTEGAAGTQRWVFTLTNPAATPCTVDGYPTLQFHSAGGWLSPTMAHGGYADINGAPQPRTVAPGKSATLTAYWSDVTTSAGSCQQFDQVRISLPGDPTTATLTGSGCVSPSQVEVGPVAA
jgi:hypothetical protein